LDLTPKHLPMLKQAREDILKYLKKNFNVNTDADNVNIYWHFPYMKDMLTFHLHARVNQRVS
jgi:hypothetical protein